jgi:hypothetical protein
MVIAVTLKDLQLKPNFTPEDAGWAQTGVVFKCFNEEKRNHQPKLHRVG